MTSPKILVYLSVARAQLQSLAHFRANIIAWILYSPIQLGIVYFLWTIVYRETEQVGGFEFRDMLLYYLLIHFLRKVIEPVQTVNYEVWSEINHGNLDIYLARPLNFGLYTFSKSLGAPLIELMVGIPFFLAFSLLLGLPLPNRLAALVIFLSSVAAAYVVLFLIQFIIGSLTFWLEGIFGIRDMIFSVFMLFSGQLIPISVLPKWISSVSRYLPFESIYYVPATIYAGDESLESLGLLHAQQLFWIVILGFVASTIWSRGVAKYASQGG